MGVPNASFSQPAGSVTTMPHGCELCHKQYASKAKLLQHQRKKHPEVDSSFQERRSVQIQVQAATTSGALTINPSLLDKPRLLAAIIQKPNEGMATEVITITPQTIQNLEALQGTDLLTQAMHELNPALTEFRSPAQVGTTIEYQLAGVVPPGGTATLIQPASLQQHQTIELSQLTQIAQNQLQRNCQQTQVLQTAGLATTTQQSINPITVVSSTQAAQVLAGAIPVSLASPYLQKAAGINWNTAQTLTQNYR
jgi:hypothetical protein